MMATNTPTEAIRKATRLDKRINRRIESLRQTVKKCIEVQAFDQGTSLQGEINALEQVRKDIREIF